jgi:hypothetical protein
LLAHCCLRYDRAVILRTKVDSGPSFLVVYPLTSLPMSSTATCVFHGALRVLVCTTCANDKLICPSCIIGHSFTDTASFAASERRRIVAAVKSADSDAVAVARARSIGLAAQADAAPAAEEAALQDLEEAEASLHAAIGSRFAALRGELADAASVHRAELAEDLAIADAVLFESMDAAGAAAQAIQTLPDVDIIANSIALIARLSDASIHVAEQQRKYRIAPSAGPGFEADLSLILTEIGRIGAVVKGRCAPSYDELFAAPLQEMTSKVGVDDTSDAASVLPTHDTGCGVARVEPRIAARLPFAPTSIDERGRCFDACGRLVDLQGRLLDAATGALLPDGQGRVQFSIDVPPPEQPLGL